MERVLRDRLLVCAECGNEFVWTVAQQRQQGSTGNAGDAPTRCAVCSVRIERMGNDRYDNGHAVRRSPVRSHRHSVTDGWAATVTRLSKGRREQRNGGARNDHADRSPSDYVSGPDHPLHGHGGEQHTGVVKWFSDKKGFGFLTLDSGIELFVHFSGIEMQGYKTLRTGQRVRVEIEDTPRGPQAGRVEVIE